MFPASSAREIDYLVADGDIGALGDRTLVCDMAGFRPHRLVTQECRGRARGETKQVVRRAKAFPPNRTVGLLVDPPRCAIEIPEDEVLDVRGIHELAALVYPLRWHGRKLIQQCYG